MPTIVPEHIKIGPADIFYGVTPPAAFVPMTQVNGAPSSGDYIGMTEGPAVFTYTPSYSMEDAEQELTPVEAFVIAEAGTLEFSMKEYEANKLMEAIQNGLLATNAVSDPDTEAIHVGGRQETRNGPAGAGQQSIFLISPQVGLFGGSGAQLYSYLTLYRAINTGPFVASYDKKKGMLNKIVFTCLAEVTRPKGDKLFQLVREGSNPGT